MPALRQLIAEGRQVAGHRPWPRALVGAGGWAQAIGLLETGQCTLLGLWGEQQVVHAALIGTQSQQPAILSFECQRRSYPSVGRRHPAAIRLERTLRDMSGLHPDGLGDTRA